MADPPSHPNPAPLTDVTAAQLNQVVGDYHDAGATSVVTTRQPNGNFTVTARFDSQPVAAGASSVLPATRSLSWNHPEHPERDGWTVQLLTSIAPRMTDLEKGDPTEFSAGYNTLAPELRERFWAELLVAMAKFESAWNPRDRYQESDGQWSVGLLQLSIGDQKNYSLAPAVNAESGLEDPLINLEWAVEIFAYWLVKDGVVATGASTRSRGAARYWSVMRAGHKVDQIKALTEMNVGLRP